MASLCMSAVSKNSTCTVARKGYWTARNHVVLVIKYVEYLWSWQNPMSFLSLTYPNRKWEIPSGFSICHLWSSDIQTLLIYNTAREGLNYYVIPLSNECVQMLGWIVLFPIYSWYKIKKKKTTTTLFRSIDHRLNSHSNWWNDRS
jgi:hypothetical protein